MHSTSCHLISSGDARAQPIYFMITMVGNDTKSICYEVHQRAKGILEGRKVAPTFCLTIFGGGSVYHSLGLLVI
ncbi:MAG: hypothetical protein IJP42_07405 [Selenomonadaceae bacterium]|nr:hypothetical protein [Selenomonadaceae bacterium]MBR0103586.1 hypothetical protein [Selenomonadaceae bacterium]